MLKRSKEELQSLLPQHLRPGPPNSAGLSIRTRVGPLPSSWRDASVEPCPRAEAQASLDAQYSVAPPYDISSFYSPAYVVDLLARLLPRLQTIHLTLVENKSLKSPTPEATNKPRSPNLDPSDNHQYPVCALTASSSIEPDDFNNLITSVRYILTSPSNKTLHPINDYHPTSSTLHTNLVAKFFPLTQTHLPKLTNLSLFFATQTTSLHAQLAEIREHVDVLASEELFGDVRDFNIFRVKTEGWQQLGLFGESGWARGKGKGKAGPALSIRVSNW